MENHKKLLLLILLGALIIRLLGSNLVIYTDEAHYTNLAAYFNSGYFLTYGPEPMVPSLSIPYFASLGFFPAIPHHPPLSMALFLISNIFFDGAFAFRIVPIVFGVLSIFMIYLLAEFVYGRRAAVISALLAAVSFYHILASVQLDQHGSTHFFFFLCAIYGYLRWERGRSVRWFIFGAVAAGLAMLNVYSAIFLFIALALYTFIQNREFVRSLIIMSVFSLISLLVYAVFPLFSFIYNRDIIIRTFLVAGLFQPVINARYIVFLLIWLGPLLLGLSVLSLRNATRKDIIFWLWILVGAIPLIFTDPNTSIDRYLMLTLPAFIILSGRFLSEIEVKRAHYALGVASFVLFYAFLMFLNLNVEYYGHVLEDYIAMASSFHWNFFFPITGPSGPAFGVVFSSIAWSLIVSFMLLFNVVVLMFMRNSGYKYFLFMFLGVTLAFSTVLAQEMLVGVAHPNYSDVNYELIRYYKEHSLPESVYTNNRALFYYLGKDGTKLHSFTETYPDETVSLISRGNITVIIFEFPKIPRDNVLWKSLQGCTLEKTAYSKGMEYGYIYRC